MMFKFIKYFLVVFLIMFSLCLYVDYILGVGDNVRVIVYGDVDLMCEIRVFEDGVIILLLVGEVKVGGLMIIEIEKRIVE